METNKIQEHYHTVLNEKRQKIKSRRKITVAFYITQKQLWSAQSVFDEFKKNNIFDPFIVVFPDGENSIDSKKTTCQENYDFFKSKKMNVKYGYNIETNNFIDYECIKADIVFFDQPYLHMPKKLSWYSIYEHALICYISYGYKIANFYEEHFNLDLQNNSWKIFAESIWHKEQFCKYGLSKGNNVIVSGYPKLDTYNLKMDTNKKYLWKISKNSTCKVKKIIWAPHWSINHEISYSTFDINYKYFLELAKSNKNISWVFKPHQKLRHHIVESGFLSKVETDEYYEAWDKLDNASFYNDSDYFELFKTSDMLITDCGSFLAEYLPTTKPIIHLINKNSHGYNEIGEKLVNSYYKANTLKDINDFINQIIINNNDYLKSERLNNLSLVQPNETGAGKCIVEYIYFQLTNHDKI